MRIVNFERIVTLTTAEPDGTRRVVMIGTVRMAVAAALAMPDHERSTARIMGEGLPPGGTWLPSFGVVALPAKGEMPRAASLANCM